MSEQDRLEAALAEFRARQNGSSVPKGVRSARGTWTPSPAEQQSCCLPHLRHQISGDVDADWIRNAALKHCRGAEHVERLFGVPSRSITNALRRARRADTRA